MNNTPYFRLNGGTKMQFINGEIICTYGKVCFEKNGKEYDLNKVLSRYTPRPGDASAYPIDGGVYVAGINLYYPKDFLPSDAVSYEDEKIPTDNTTSDPVVPRPDHADTTKNYVLLKSVVAISIIMSLLYVFWN
jgi:hypothetical protein